MPITRSAQKALRQSVRRRSQNLRKNEAYKKAAGEVRKAVAADKKSDAQKLLPKLYKTLDKAAKTGAIKKNKAARIKSRLTRLAEKSGK